MLHKLKFDRGRLTLEIAKVADRLADDPDDKCFLEAEMRRLVLRRQTLDAAIQDAMRSCQHNWTINGLSRQCRSCGTVEHATGGTLIFPTGTMRL